MYKKIKKFLAVITVSTGALFAINGASSALASEYLAAPQNFPAELTASGTQISGDELTYKSDVTKYDIKYSAKMNVSSIWSYYNYYVMFDPSDNKAASNATVIKGGFTITFTSADVLAIKDGVDLKSMVENNVSTDKDNGVYGSSSKFYDYFVVESVTKSGNNLVIKMNVKDGVDGIYLASKRSELPKEILIQTLADYTSVNGTDLTNDQKIVSSGTYEGKIILDTPDNYAVALQSAINSVRSNPILGFLAGAYFPTNATAPVTSLAIPVNSSSEHTLNVVKKEANMYIKIDKTGQYEDVEGNVVELADQKAIFHIGNKFSNGFKDLNYTVYSDAAKTEALQENAQVTWTIEALRGFEMLDLSEYSATLPTLQTTYEVGKINTNKAIAIKSGIYKVTATLPNGESDYAYVVVPGDVDRDGEVSTQDANEITRYSVSEEFVSFSVRDEFTKILADIDYDYDVTTNDSLLATRMALQDLETN